MEKTECEVRLSLVHSERCVRDSGKNGFLGKAFRRAERSKEGAEEQSKEQKEEHEGGDDEVDAALLARTESRGDRTGCKGETPAQNVNLAIGSVVPVYRACHRMGESTGFCIRYKSIGVVCRDATSSSMHPEATAEGCYGAASGVTVFSPWDLVASTGNGQVETKMIRNGEEEGRQAKRTVEKADGTAEEIDQ